MGRQASSGVPRWSLDGLSQVAVSVWSDPALITLTHQLADAYTAGRIVIVETIVTSVDSEGTVNCAPMGVEWGEDVIVLKPFLETATYSNVLATRAAVVNLTDDVRVFARAAIENPQYPTVPAVEVRGVVLAECCSWWEVEVRSIDRTPPRSRIETAVVHHGNRREFIGFNRASHAVLEATIYATRLHLLSRAFVESELVRLQVIVDKTAGPAELEAMTLLTRHVRSVPVTAEHDT